MAPLYFYLNAVLYLGLAVWCTLSPRATAAAVGFLQLNSSGESEYRVIYGGLQLGLAICFFFLARRSELWQLGVLFALALYGPIVAYRLVTVLAFWPVSAVTLATAGLEIVMLALAAFLLVAGVRA
jgi:hypothetical protein